MRTDFEPEGTARLAALRRLDRPVRRLALLVALLVACLPAAGAQAAGVTGYQEVTNTVTITAGSTGNVASVTCPSGVVVGGGYTMAHDDGAAVTASMPAGAGWTVHVDAGSSDQPVDVYAICLAASTPGFAQHSSSATVTAGSTQTVSQACPSGTVVLSGGYDVVSGGVLVYSSSPSANSSIVNNTWSVFALNNSRVTQNVTVYAICATQPTGYQEPSPSQSAAPGVSTEPAACSSGNVLLGGGYTIENPSNEFVLGASPAGGRVSPSQNTWNLQVNNRSTSPLVAQPTAICATPAPPPAISAINPTSGPTAGGNTVTITGSGFTGANAVNFGATAAASFTVVSDTQITATAPTGSGTVDISVVAPGGSTAATTADRYTYIPPPDITSVSPTSGPTAGGNTVTITGSGFTGANAVNFGATAAASFTVVSDTQITATAPAGGGTVDITVLAPAGTSATTASDRYTYQTAPAAPGASGTAVKPVSTTAAALTGSVVPNGQVTTVHFEYGLDNSLRAVATSGIVYDQSTPSQILPADFASHQLTATVTQLVPNALYHVRLVASSGNGTTSGPDGTFHTAADPQPPPPVVGRSFDVIPTSGLVLVKLPGTQRFIPVTEARQLPSGTVVDVRRGTIQIVIAAATGGKLQSGNFWGGLFTFTQARRGRDRGLATLSLLRGLPGLPPFASVCTSRAAADAPPVSTASAGSRILSLLHARAHGRFRTRGRYAAGTVRGTIWDTEDRCDGTLIHVIRGRVEVQNLLTGKRHIVPARHSLLVSPPKRKHSA